MAAAVSIARYLLNEASSGTTPTTCADDQGSNDLTIDYSSGDANWTSIAAGNGLDFTATAVTTNSAIAELADIATNGNIGSSLDSTGEVSFLLRCEIDAGHAFGSRLLAIGTNSGDTDLSLVVDTSGLRLRWDQESGGVDDEVSYAIPTGLVTIGVSINTAEVAASDRVKLYIDGVEELILGGDITQNSVLDAINATSRSFSLGNRPSQNRNIDGQIYYAELFTGVLTATQHSDAHTALASDNDADWNSSGLTVTPSGLSSAEAIGSAVITTGAVNIAPSGISSAEALGSATLSSIYNLSPSSIASAEAMGSHVLSVGAVIVQPSSLSSSEAFGSATVATNAVVLSPSGVASAEAIGLAVLSLGPVTILPSGITTAEAIGSAVLSNGVLILPLSIESLEALGNPVLSVGNVTLLPVGIASNEQIGAAVIGDIIIVGEIAFVRDLVSDICTDILENIHG